MIENIKVCVWDNDKNNCKSMIDTINEVSGYFAGGYENGMADIQELLWKNPQILLIDIDYTITEPKRFIKNIKMQIPHLKLIAVSAELPTESIDELKKIGFDQVLNKSFSHEDFVNAVSIFTKHKVNRCKIISFFSPKGKSGKTTLIVNLATAIANITQKKVAIIDADTVFADIDVFFNINPKSTIVETLRDIEYLSKETVLRYFEEVVQDVYILSGAKDPQLAGYITDEGLEKLVKLVRDNFDYILIDTSAGFNLVNIKACELANKVYVMAMHDDDYEMYHLERAMEIFHSLDDWQKRVEIAIMRLKPDLNKKSELERKLSVPVTLLPNEYIQSAKAVNYGSVGADESSALAKEIFKMAEHICKRAI